MSEKRQSLIEHMYEVYMATTPSHFVDYYINMTWSCVVPAKKKILNFEEFSRKAKIEKIISGIFAVKSFSRTDGGYIYGFELTRTGGHRRKINIPMDAFLDTCAFNEFLMEKEGIDFSGTESDFELLQNQWSTQVGEMIYANY